MANRIRIHNPQQLTWGSVLDETTDVDDVRAQQRDHEVSVSGASLEDRFDSVFATQLALREKQIQQSYRPIIGIHKWFARRPGTLFRSLLLAEYNGAEPLETSYWREHKLTGIIADPFMGGGSPIFEANRLGFSIVGADTNPMAFWVVRQALGHLDIQEFASTAGEVATDIESIVGSLYETACVKCGNTAEVKYFLWVKTERCPLCQAANDLFPGYVLARDSRHPNHVLVCSQCGCLNEYKESPSKDTPGYCAECNGPVYAEGPVRRHRVPCKRCGNKYPYPTRDSGHPPAHRNPTRDSGHPPAHRMWAMEYYCKGVQTNPQRAFLQASRCRRLGSV